MGGKSFPKEQLLSPTLPHDADIVPKFFGISGLASKPPDTLLDQGPYCDERGEMFGRSRPLELFEGN